jgi:glycosyltransferase involved in cell wall biosynthesis
MRVLLMSPGPVDYTIAYANGLADHAEVAAILPQDAYASLGAWIDRRVGLDLVDWPRHRSLRNPAFQWDLSRRIHKLRPDVVHLLSNTTLWLNAAAPFWPWPLVTTVHDVTRHPGDRDTARLPDWAARLMARQSDRLVVHGASLRGDAARHFGKPMNRVHVLPHPAIQRYAALARKLGLVRAAPPHQFTILLFGRIFAYKGLKTLLRAEALLGEELPGLRMVIAGRGDDPWSLSSLMGDPARYDIRRGFVEDHTVAQLFTDADVVVLPYDEASQSGVLHVAGSFGKPVVVTDVGELRAAVEPNQIGLVVPPGDPVALAAALLRLARDPALRAAQGARALSWSEGVNSPSTIGASAMAIYDEMMMRRRGSWPNECKA